MEGFALIIVAVILVMVIIALIIYNASLSKKIQNFNNINQKITGLNVLQDFMSTAGDTLTVDEKIKKINDILIEQYKIKYSTIVQFDGTEYVVKASNVDQKHWDALRNLQNEEIFQDSITSAKPKYITVNKETERLPYQKMEFGRAKSAMFFPLYIDNVYIGYWIIESGEMHAFDQIDTTILEIVKDNILSIFKIVSYQNILENIVRDDLYSDLKTGEYLYEKGRAQIDKYTTSTICMFKMCNLEEINKNYNRDTGNQVIIDVCDYIKENLYPEYIFVRYMGPKFVIVFPGIEKESVVEFLSDIKQKVEAMKIEEVIEEGKKVKNIRNAQVLLNMVFTTYYKGTAIESVLKKLEEYLDEAEGESDINDI